MRRHAQQLEQASLMAAQGTVADGRGMEEEQEEEEGGRKSVLWQVLRTDYAIHTCQTVVPARVRATLNVRTV
jgi:hypothetical protein